MKIKSISLTISETTGAATSAYIMLLFDRIDTTIPIISRIYNDIKLRISVLASDSKILYFNDLNILVGDRIVCYSSSGNFLCTAIINYEIIKSDFDQYGQAEKTLSRTINE